MTRVLVECTRCSSSSCFMEPSTVAICAMATWCFASGSSKFSPAVWQPYQFFLSATLGCLHYLLRYLASFSRFTSSPPHLVVYFGTLVLGFSLHFFAFLP
ncbi:hypothetical protein EDB83DRAFT_2388304 [Lactarius deliciosus]|nr:hypothetical protein EDB83DRAFT_2388304 [Lactarius deliciosus]